MCIRSKLRKLMICLLNLDVTVEILDLYPVFIQWSLLTLCLSYHQINFQDGNTVVVSEE